MPYFVYYYYCILIRQWYAVGTSFFRVYFFSILTPLFIVFVCPIFLFHSCCAHARVFGKTLCMSSPFPIAILNGTSFFLSLVQDKLNMPRGQYCRLCSRSGRSNHLIKKIKIHLSWFRWINEIVDRFRDYEVFLQYLLVAITANCENSSESDKLLVQWEK